MKKKSDKKKDLDSLHKELEASKNVFLTGFEKMTVSQDYELRKTIRGAGAKYKVIKNNIAEKAAEGTDAQALIKNLAGMTAMAYTSGDPVALAKALTAYAKVNPTFTFKAGMVESRVINLAQITDLVNMPPKEELIAKVMFLVNASAQRLAVSLNGVARNLAVVLDQAIKENKFKA